MNRTFIIAEAGINCSGSIDIAKQLIKESKEIGIDAIKFQKRDLNSTYTQDELNKYRESPFGTTNRALKEYLEFSIEEYKIIDDYCKEVSLPWFFSAWDLKSFKDMKHFNCPYNKVASARLGHIELLKLIAEERKPTFISTGMSTMSEIYRAVQIFDEANCPYTLLHCTSTYPCPTEDLNLNMIRTLQELFSCNVGYSCHSPGIIFPIVAVVLGATVIEKHITLDRTSFGSDQAASMEMHGMKKMIEFIRDTELSLGSGEKSISEVEQKIREKLWRTNDI